MADVLSQSEVESLLAALDPTGPPSASPPPVRAQQQQQHRFDEIGAQVSVYDFKRPERVSKEQMRAFQALHEGFSREFGAAMSGMLRTIVEVKLISVDQLTYSEFVFSLENPTCFNLLRSEGLDGHMILDLNPSIIFPVVARLLGGGKGASKSFPGRPLTEIELRLVSRIIRLAMTGLENSWKNIVPLKLAVMQVESNPQLVQIVPPNEVIVLISFEIAMGDMREIMNLCIPFNTIEPLTGKLSSDSWSAYTKRELDPRQKLNLETSLSKANVEMVACLAETQLTYAEIQNLAVGDVIMTEKATTDSMNVYIEGRPMFHGFAGMLKGHRAIRVGQVVIRPEDLVEQKLAVADPPKPPKRP
jgi:flagellar motor switch protein FliM